jgi:hypothetical protein
MTAKFTHDDAQTESAHDYREYRDAYGSRDRNTQKMEVADALARTLFKRLNERHDLIRSGLPTSRGRSDGSCPHGTSL